MWRGAQLVICAADRMITARDIEFEQPQPKIFQLGDHSVALISGNGLAQATIATEAQKTLLAKKLTRIDEIARVYANESATHRSRAASDAILAPLGLDLDTFLARQQSMSPQLVLQLVRQLQEYEFSGGLGRAIVAGADDRGGHLYVVSEPGIETRMDSIGFVATGIGQRHAESQFMFAGYTWRWDFAQALFLTYVAKKRAEVAPGVGSATDLVIITTAPRGLFHIVDSTDMVKLLDAAYTRTRRGEQALTTTAYKRVQEQLEKLLTGGQPQTTPPAIAAQNQTTSPLPPNGH